MVKMSRLQMFCNTNILVIKALSYSEKEDLFALIR